MRVKKAIKPPRRVLVGSRNAPKVGAVRDAFRRYFGGVRVSGVAVEPGVPQQPIGWAEILEGAKSRARRAFEAGPCDVGVGYEDGLVPVAGTGTGHVNFGCCAIFDGRRFTLGFSGGFEYPTACTRRAVGARRPVGDTFDAVFARATGRRAPENRPSALTIGNVGMLTGRKLTRREYTRHAVIGALIQLRHPQLYPGDS
jgi:inosine/xanthosine triphosphatase